MKCMRMSNENNTDNYRIDRSKIITCESFEYKTKIIGSTPIDNNTLGKVVVPLKYSGNFLDSP